MNESRWRYIIGIAMTLVSFGPMCGVAADITTILVAETAPNYWQVPAFLSNASGPTNIANPTNATNPSDWTLLKPNLWSAYNVPPAQGQNT